MRFISGEDLRNGVVLTPADVERELVYIVEQIEAGSALLVKHSEELAEKETTLGLRMAQTQYRSKEKSLDRRQAEAVAVNEDLWSEVQLLKARVRLIRDTQHDLRAELEAVRSIGASVRSSMWEGQGQGGGLSGQGQGRSGRREQQPQGRSWAPGD